MSERNTIDPFHVTRVVEHARVLVSLEKDGRSPSRHKQARRPVVARGAARRGAGAACSLTPLLLRCALRSALTGQGPSGRLREPAHPRDQAVGCCLSGGAPEGPHRGEAQGAERRPRR